LFVICTAPNCREDQYECDDGNCVEGWMRCDGRPQCEDSSDEFGCRKFDIWSIHVLKGVWPYI